MKLNNAEDRKKFEKVTSESLDTLEIPLELNAIMLAIAELYEIVDQNSDQKS